MPRPTISLEAAIGPESTDDLFVVGTSLVGGTDVIAGGLIVGQGSWEELGDVCDSISIRRGRQRLLEQYQAGTTGATFDNFDRRLDPTWDDGPYSEGGVSNLVADRALRSRANYLGVDFDLSYGFTDNGWALIPQYPEGGRSAVTATDAFKVLNNITLPADVSQGAGDTTGERLHRLLDAVNWPDDLRDLDEGSATHQATTLEGNVLTQMRLAVDGERGDLYVAPNGVITFRGRLSRLTSSRSRYVQWTLGDGDGELNPSSFETANDESLKRNDVYGQREGGEVVSRRSAEADTYPHLRRTYSRADLTLETDTQVADWADWVLRLFAESRPRIDWVEYRPDGYEDLWPLVIGAQIGDRVAVNLTHPYDGSRWEGEYFIEGVEHDIPVLESGGVWRTRFYLAETYGFPTNPFIVGSSLVGGTDVVI